MPFAIPALKRSPTGAYAARKSIPKDIRDTYERLYGQRWETKFSLPALTRPQEAKARFAAWLAEIEERITAIRDGRAVVAGAASRCLDVRNNTLPSAKTAIQTSATPWTLFEQWVAAKQPRPSSVNRWRCVFLDLEKHFNGNPACSIASDDAQAWAEGLMTSERHARTVNDIWCSAAKAVFGWAVKTRKLASNPFDDARVTEPRKIRTRETDEFSSAEATLILTAALDFNSAPAATFDAAKRWVPWLCAYSGARPGEITQLRSKDVIKQEGIWVIKITPEAGTVKAGKPRTVPLHEHLIAQGFPEFARSNGNGPLFYNTRSPLRATTDDPTKPMRSRSVKTRERLASWVRSIGVTDTAVRPNHAWRHTFKRRAARAGIEKGIRDAICGHSPGAVGDQYETPTVADMTEALKKFPRYEA
jgi:integrase